MPALQIRTSRRASVARSLSAAALTDAREERSHSRKVTGMEGASFLAAEMVFEAVVGLRPVKRIWRGGWFALLFWVWLLLLLRMCCCCWYLARAITVLAPTPAVPGLGWMEWIGLVSFEGMLGLRVGNVR